MKNRGKKRAMSKAIARQPFGPWERREFSAADLMRLGLERPLLKRGERWGRVSYVNNRYSVQVSSLVTSWGVVTHLWIRRHDGRPARNWPDLQRIKSEICSPEHVALEVYPADVDVVDQANMTHLWVLEQGFKLPFGLHRDVSLGTRPPGVPDTREQEVCDA